MAPATPTWPQPAQALSKLTPNKVGPLVAYTERDVVYLTHAQDLEQMILAIFPENTQQFICNDFADSIVLFKYQKGPSIKRGHSLNKYLLSTYYAHVSGVGLKKGRGGC